MIERPNRSERERKKSESEKSTVHDVDIRNLYSQEEWRH